MSVELETKPNGPVAAVFLAAGVGTLVLGLLTSLNEASKWFKDNLSFDLNDFLKFDAHYGLGNGVGPLSGKTALAVIAFVVAWAIAWAIWRDKQVNFRTVFWVSLVLVALGFLLTFPLVFEYFVVE